MILSLFLVDWMSVGGRVSCNASVDETRVIMSAQLA